jgi:hypothetical protein
MRVVLPPPPTMGKATGGGSITVHGGIGTFGFIVQRQTTTGPISDDLQYVNHASGAKVNSVMFTTLVVTGNSATFGGTCTNNGVPCTFSVNVTDNGEPGTSDTVSITGVGQTPANGTLQGGHIQIRSIEEGGRAKGSTRPAWDPSIGRVAKPVPDCPRK